jgi:hypothetical protein
MGLEEATKRGGEIDLSEISVKIPKDEAEASLMSNNEW